MEMTSKHRQKLEEARYLALRAIDEIESLGAQKHVRPYQFNECIASLHEAHVQVCRVAGRRRQ